MGRHGPDFAESISDSLDDQDVRIRPRFDLDDDDLDFDASILQRIEDNIEDAFERAGNRVRRPGGPINLIGRSIGDAIGAGFNVSGRSPLLIFLIPLLGVIIALILGAVQAVGALVAVLTTLPALVTAIGLQVGVLALAWDGVGKAATAAFSAKNAKELNEAIKGLTPSAQEFVKSLLPVRDLFRDLKELSQESFFRALGDSVGELFEVLGPVLRAGLPALAGALGGFFAELTAFFGSPTFITFIEDVIPATLSWLDRFGLGFVAFLEGLIMLGNAALPFLERLGAGLATWLGDLGQWFTDVADDPSFLEWLDRMESTLSSVFELLGAVIGFIAVFADELDKAGGEEIIREFSRAFLLLSLFLQSEAGHEAMRGLVNLSILFIRLTTAVILGILTIIASLQAFFHFITDDLVPGVEGAFSDLTNTFTNLVESIIRILAGGKVVWDTFVLGVKQKATDVEVFFAGLPGRVKAAIANLGTIALEAGKNFLDSLINGILSRVPQLEGTIGYVIKTMTKFLPGSPAEEGPLSGSGYSLYRGQRLMQDFARGISMETEDLRMASLEATSNVVFNRDSIRVDFEGTLPTRDQAQATGAAVGTGIANQLKARSARLAVRMV